MSFIPSPCPPAGGTPSDPGFDVEQNILCDVGPDGEVLGTALAVYEYDAETGAPVGPPTFVNPATGDPYVAQGTLMPCPGEVGCLEPVQFCFTSTATGPVDHPGRQYDITLPINPGFSVESMNVDAVNHPANITWSVLDVDGQQFRSDLESFISGRMPAGTTTTVTNPNAGAPVCGEALPMTIHIECARLDQNPPNLVELVYNAGQDLVVNPAYLTTPPTDLSNVQFVYLRRQDQGGTLNCTSVANRGWETNDNGGVPGPDFELWGTGPGGLQQQENATPTPRGTPIQEITADISGGPNPLSTIWQTFQVTAAGNFNVTMVHGARDAGEQHTIRLSTGDTGDSGPGDIINNVTNPPSVTSSGGPNPWTQFNQTVPLAPGLYTFSISTTNPVGANRGGLFTDMRVFLDAPGTRATAVNDDDTCVVSVEETTTVTDCQLWAPRCINGTIISWYNVETGAELDNAAFWGQAPAPQCCIPEPSTGGGGSVAANLVHNYEICGIVGGIPTTLNRVVITDPSGGVLAETIVGPNGAPVAPSSYTIGACSDVRFLHDEILCDDNGRFLRKYIQGINASGFPTVNAIQDFTLSGQIYTAVGTVIDCSERVRDAETQLVCDGASSTTLIASYIYDESGAIVSTEYYLLDGTGPVVPAGPLYEGGCCQPINIGPACYTAGSGRLVGQRRCHTDDPVAFDVFWYDAETGEFVPTPTIIPCTDAQTFDFEEEILCDNNGPFIRRYSYVDGVVAATTNFDLAGAAYVPVGPVVVCPTTVTINQEDIEIVTLCDDNGGFLRRFTFDAETGLPITVITTDFDGNPYVPVGTIRVCDQTVTVTELDSELEILCDNVGSFLRRYIFNETTGAIGGTTDFTFAGAAYVPTGPVVRCQQADFDITEEVLCDDNGGFIRRFTFNSITGVLVSSTDLTLAGAAYVPVGTVTKDCAACCPIEVGEVCLANGHKGVVVRQPNGTLTYTDVQTGLAFNPATDIVACVTTVAGALNQIDSTIQRQTGAGSIVIAAGARSVTLTVLNSSVGAVTATIDGDPAVTVPAGVSLTWAVDDRDEQLLNAHTFTGVLGSDFIVTSTRQ